MVKRLWSSILELSAWCIGVGRGVLKRFWSSVFELSARCFEVGSGRDVVLELDFGAFCLVLWGRKGCPEAVLEVDVGAFCLVL